MLHDEGIISLHQKRLQHDLDLKGGAYVSSFIALAFCCDGPGKKRPDIQNDDPAGGLAVLQMCMLQLARASEGKVQAGQACRPKVAAASMPCYEALAEALTCSI